MKHNTTVLHVAQTRSTVRGAISPKGGKAWGFDADPEDSLGQGLTKEGLVTSSGFGLGCNVNVSLSLPGSLPRLTGRAKLNVQHLFNGWS